MEDIGIYVHIPFCSGKCAYCSFISTVNSTKQPLFIERLLREIDDCRYCGNVTSIYVGGGTPSVLNNGYLSQIFTKIRSKYTVECNSEITTEINPESATEEFLSECERNGVNRISIGLQCADDEILKAAGRRHSVSDFVNAVELAKKHGMDNISADLMLGLPGETDKKIIDSLNLLFELGIRHVSVYSLSVEKGCVMYSKKYLPDEDAMADQYGLVSKILRDNGYERYEVSNFAKEGKFGKHNMKYWLHKPYLGFGPSAHSFFNGLRFANTDKISDYLDGTTKVSEEPISREGAEEEFIMLRLRLNDGISLSEYRRLFDKKFEDGRESRLQKMYDAGVIEKKDDRIFATEKGIYILNYIITELI